jgi:N-acetyl-anhydromuramyl-L-alanine amidase AmpD
MALQTGRGWMPGVAQSISPNIYKGRAGLAIRAAVIHIAQGTYAGSISWLCNPASGASAHFMVAKDGRIMQMVNIFDTAWGNGLTWNTLRNSWIDPDGNAVKPSWKGLTVPINPNFTTVSIEHEGFTGEPWTAAMYEADRRILQYVASQTPLSYIPHDTLIGHNEISPLARSQCPGSGVDFARMIEPELPYGTVPIDPRLQAYWERSGGLWQPDRYCLGYAIRPLTNGIQVFERGALRLRPDGGIDALLLREAIGLLP